MCGILGVAGCHQIDRTQFKHALDLIKHRGPDSTDTLFWSDVAFGFVRLAIQDLSDAGRQPMRHANKPVTIIFNGEIYNFKILRAKLITEGAIFYTQTDTEVILNAYVLWGWEKTLKSLEGMFGLALYDETENRIFLARDRFGQKPLFFKNSQKLGLIFASEIKSILSLADATEIDLFSSFNPIFTTGLSPRGKTCFKDIEQLSEGEYLVYDIKSKSVHRQKYFTTLELIEPDLYNEIKGYTKTKLLDTYLKAFEESVELHLISDAPLASLFSAGLDSSFITDIAARSTNIDLYHFESELHDFQHHAKDFAAERKLNLKIWKGEDTGVIE